MSTPARDEEERGLRERLEKLEESCAFEGRTVEQLSAEMAEINRRLAEALARVARLERRIESMAEGRGGEGDEEPESPPEA